jgi:flagellar biogenesis protein FliO
VTVTKSVLRRPALGQQALFDVRSAWGSSQQAVRRTAADKPVRHALRDLRLFSFLRSAWNSIRRTISPLQLRCGSRRLRTLETLPLGEKRAVLLVRVDGQEFLLGSTEKTVSLLAELDGPQDKEQSKEKVTGIRTSPRTAELVASFNSSVQ